METIITLLRGINVGGQRKIKMDGLRTLYESLGFESVTSYIQSGNIVCKNHLNDLEQARVLIEEKIKEEYNFDVTIFIYSLDDFKALIERNPYAGSKEKESRFFHATLLAALPDKQQAMQLETAKKDNEEFTIMDRTVYLYLPNGYGRTKLTNSVFEKKLQVSATTRNWKTMLKLYDMASGLAP